MKTRAFSIYFIYLWLGLFCLVPLAGMLIASFMTRDSINLVSMPFTLSNYLDLLNPQFIRIFLRSLVIALITTVICLLLAWPFCYSIVQSRYRSVLLMLVIIPFWTSSLIRTYSLVALLKFHGLLNMLLLKLHLIHEPVQWLYSNFAVISGLVYNLLPFMILPLFSNMERFDFRLVEAARDLGASNTAIFFKVLLPNTMAGIFAGCIMVLLPAMTLFYIPNILGGARSILLGNLIQNQFLVLDNWPEGAASSMLLTLLLMLLLAACKRYFSRDLVS